MAEFIPKLSTLYLEGIMSSVRHKGQKYSAFVVETTPQEFLRLAFTQVNERKKLNNEPPSKTMYDFPKTEPETFTRLIHAMNMNEPVDVPVLIVKEGKLEGHNGRNRCLVAEYLGIEKIFVVIRVLDEVLCDIHHDDVFMNQVVKVLGMKAKIVCADCLFSRY